jgi:hypothetical protein
MRDISKAAPPLELVLKGGDPNKIAIWGCGTCHNAAATPEMALECCAPWKCETCGVELKPHHYCDACSEKELQAREKATYDKAKHVTLEVYPGDMLFCAHCDEYFWDVGEFLDSHDDGTDIPTWCYGTYETPFSLDAESIIDQQLEQQEFYEDAIGNVSGEAVKEMQSFFDGWLVKNRLTSYMVDHSVVVDLDKQVEEHLKERATS